MKLTAILIPMALVAAVPATAQLKSEPPLGSGIPRVPETFPVDQSRDVLSDFAQCAVKKNPNLTREVVLDTVHTVIGKAHRTAANRDWPDCLGWATQLDEVQLTITPFVLRASFADVLVQNDLQTFDPQQIRVAAPLSKTVFDPAELLEDSDKRLTAEELRRREAETEADLALIAYGECVVRKDPAGARTLLWTKINSDAELQAFQAMMPGFSGCLNVGQQFKADRLLLRGAIALNYYRLAYAPKLAATAREAAE
jgi:hypothetical protein